MDMVNMHEAKTHLSKLVQRASRGETILIARSGQAVARLVPLESKPDDDSPRLGFLSGRITTPDDFDTMGAESITASFAGDE